MNRPRLILTRLRGLASSWGRQMLLLREFSSFLHFLPLEQGVQTLESTPFTGGAHVLCALCVFTMCYMHCPCLTRVLNILYPSPLSCTYYLKRCI